MARTLGVEESLSTRYNHYLSSTRHRLAATYELDGEYAQAQFCTRHQLELEPWDKTTCQQLMRALVLGGQHSAAPARLWQG